MYFDDVRSAFLSMKMKSSIVHEDNEYSRVIFRPEGEICAGRQDIMNTQYSKTETENEIKIISETLLSKGGGHKELRKADFNLNILNKLKRKKLFDPEKMSCKSCGKWGHVESFCPVLSNWNVPEEMKGKKEYQEFVNVLLSKNQFAQIETKNAVLSSINQQKLNEEVQRVMSEGRKINEMNPYKERKEQREQLRAKLGFWKALGVNTTTLSWILNGVPIRLEREPERVYFTRPPRDKVQQKFVEEEIEMHLKDGSFEVIEKDKVRVGNPLTIASKAGGKMRMCVDSRYVNAFMASPDFKMETLVKVAELIEPDDILFTTDLKKAYYAVQIDENARGLFAFNAKADASGRWIAPRVVVFGEAQAPWAFSKIQRKSIVEWARSMGIRVVNYIDDFIWMCKRNELPWVRENVQKILQLLGWETNDKCDWEGRTCVKFLGFEVDSDKMEFRVGNEKGNKIIQVVNQMLKDKVCTNDSLRSLVGKIIATKIAMEPAQLFTRALSALISNEQNTETKIKLNKEALDELLFWQEKWFTCNGRPIVTALGGVIVRGKMLEMNADAGAIGFGAHLQDGSEVKEILPLELLHQSSTVRELFGLQKCLSAMTEKLKGNTVCVKLDSLPAVRNIVKGGGPVAECSLIVQNIWKWCEQNKIKLTVEWIPREMNTKADALSKACPSKWNLKEETRLKIMEIKNGEEAKIVGELEQNKKTWMIPDFNTLSYVINHMISKQIKGIIIHPVWEAQVWWPRLCEFRYKVVDLGGITDCCNPATLYTEKVHWQMQASWI
jgi:hypothetical protein